MPNLTTGSPWKRREVPSAMGGILEDSISFVRERETRTSCGVVCSYVYLKILSDAWGVFAELQVDRGQPVSAFRSRLNGSDGTEAGTPSSPTAIFIRVYIMYK